MTNIRAFSNDLKKALAVVEPIAKRDHRMFGAIIAIRDDRLFLTATDMKVAVEVETLLVFDPDEVEKIHDVKRRWINHETLKQLKSLISAGNRLNTFEFNGDTVTLNGSFTFEMIEPPVQTDVESMIHKEWEIEDHRTWWNSFDGNPEPVAIDGKWVKHIPRCLIQVGPKGDHAARVRFNNGRGILMPVRVK